GSNLEHAVHVEAAQRRGVLPTPGARAGRKRRRGGAPIRLAPTVGAARPAARAQPAAVAAKDVGHLEALAAAAGEQCHQRALHGEPWVKKKIAASVPRAKAPMAVPSAA